MASPQALHEAAAAPTSPQSSPQASTATLAARASKTAASKWLDGKPPSFVDASNIMIAQIERAQPHRHAPHARAAGRARDERDGGRAARR